MNDLDLDRRRLLGGEDLFVPYQGELLVGQRLRHRAHEVWDERPASATKCPDRPGRRPDLHRVHPTIELRQRLQQ